MEFLDGHHKQNKLLRELFEELQEQIVVYSNH